MSQPFYTPFPSHGASWGVNEWSLEPEARCEVIISLSSFLLLLRIQAGKFQKLPHWFRMDTWCLSRLICTLDFGTDWVYCFGISDVFNFEVFPLIPGRLGVLRAWVNDVCVGKQTVKETVEHVASYFGMLKREHEQCVFCPRESQLTWNVPWESVYVFVYVCILVVGQQMSRSNEIKRDSGLNC